MNNPKKNLSEIAADLEKDLQAYYNQPIAFTLVVSNLTPNSDSETIEANYVSNLTAEASKELLDVAIENIVAGTLIPNSEVTYARH